MNKVVFEYNCPCCETSILVPQSLIKETLRTVNNKKRYCVLVDLASIMIDVDIKLCCADSETFLQG